MRSLPHDPRKLLAIYLGGVVGALLLGWFFALFRDRPAESLRHPFLATGICGTLTTFSTLQLELYRLADDGHLALAAAYAATTIAAGYLFLRLGIALERRRVDLVALYGTKSPGGER